MSRRMSLSLPLSSLALVGLLGCAAVPDGPDLSPRCVLRVWYSADRALARPDLAGHLTPAAAVRPELIGSWNAFRRPGLSTFDVRIAPDGEAWRTLTLALPPGRYLYGILAGDNLLTDNIEPQSAFAPDPRFANSAPYEAELSVGVVPDCSQPTLTVVTAAADDDGRLRFVADFVPGDGDGLDAAALTTDLSSGGAQVAPPRFETQVASLPASADAPARSRITVTAAGLPPGKYTLRLTARSRLGRQPPVAAASLFVEPPGLAFQRSLADAVVYQIIVDRFRGPGGTLPPPPTPGSRAGGTLGGVRQAVEAGYFGRLGVTTLWLSPLYKNPPGTFTGLDGHPYQAYHGYWPTEPRLVEDQLGGAAELDALVAAAHARGLRVIFDAVPNHVYKDHPYYRDHSRQSPSVSGAADPDAESWFNDGRDRCVCGSPGCPWSSRIEDCWFDTYLPDLNWRHPMVMQVGSDDLLWWLQRFDLDGMRIDAVPMMPRAATRRIVRATRDASFAGGLDRLLVGEDYTGPGDAGRIDIRSFLGQRFDGLDSAFDFPLMWAARDALANEHAGLDTLEAEWQRSQAAWAGSGAVMAHILDNHDTPRFFSEAVGNAGNDPWADPPPQPPDGEAYRKQLLGLALLLTLPGIPVLYYGDEIGLAGANDPDSRRTLPDVLGGGLPAPQAALLQATARLGRLRACLPALRRGERTSLLADRDHLVALHRPPAPAAADPVLVVLSRDRDEARLTVAGLPPGRYQDALSGEVVVVDGDPARLPAHPLAAALYLPQGHPCLADVPTPPVQPISPPGRRPNRGMKAP